MCAQIREGYPFSTYGEFLTRDSGTISYVVFTVYRAIPFVYELRTLLDWICTPTTLIFYEWLVVEDIYTELYNRKCGTHPPRLSRLAAGLCWLVRGTDASEWWAYADLQYFEEEGRKFGAPQTRRTKCCTGVLLFIGLLLVVWLPLLLFSGANPASEPNPVLSAELSLGTTPPPPQIGDLPPHHLLTYCGNWLCV